ncbi:MAG TPA: chemotaxis protein CheA, partial [Myxococcota bacterium]|nr:chemotaxis protein CheA [Myxococcota bacterium]
APSVRSVSRTVRVDIRRLDRLMNLVGELGLTRAAFLRITDAMKRERGFSGLAVDLYKEGRNFERRLAELQAGIMEVRMVPLENLFERMQRIGRKIGRELKREVRIDTTGENTELDKLIVEDLADPLMHLIRNALDHGIEPPEERVAAGKPGEGVVKLTAAAQGNHVVVEVSDDGRGIDVKRTLAIAVERGLVTPERAAELTRREIFTLLLLPGFSTRTEVSEYSGRGVGMDVVKTNIAQLSGVIDIDSQEGMGTKVVVTLPITLAIIPALIVAVAGRIYAIPLNNVQETLALTANDVKTIERREVISVRGSTVPLLDLRRLFKLPDEARPKTVYAVVAGAGQNRMALVVDDLVAQQDIVIKSLGRWLRNVPGVAGAAELGNSQTILVIDMVELLGEMSAEGQGGTPRRSAP